METKESTVWRYTAAAVIGLIVGAAIVFAIAPGKDELNQVRMQRDALNIEIQTFKEQIGPLKGEVKTLQEQNAAHKSELDRLAGVLAETERAGTKAAEQVGPLHEEVKTLREQNAGLKSEIGRLTVKLAEQEQAGAKAGGELAERRRAMAGLEERNRTLAAENEGLKKKLAGLGEKVEAAAAERDALARKLGAAGRTLNEAQARSAELNKSYEALLTEKTTLAEREAVRRAELEKTKKAFEDAQSEVARLMGARGIYTVQNGDSLSTIAAFFYRDGLRWSDIFKANSFLISHPDLIYPKQVLIIPH